MIKGSGPERTGVLNRETEAAVRESFPEEIGNRSLPKQLERVKSGGICW